MNPAPAYHGNLHRKLAEVNEWTKRSTESALEPELPIIDPHHHLWDDTRGRYLIEELLEDTRTGHNIIATVFIETGLKYRDTGPAAMKPLGEVEFVAEASAPSARGQFGAPRLCAGIIGHADLKLGDGVRPVMEALLENGDGRVRGIRHGVPWDNGNVAKFGRHNVPEHLLLDPAFGRGFAHLEPLGLSFECWMFHPQLADLPVLLRRFPDTRVILNHVGGLLGVAPHDGKRDEIFATWRNQIRELAKFQNLTVKLGGLGMLHCGWDFHLRDVPPTSQELADVWRPYIETCIEAFGASRCMMESNFPPDKQTCGYGVLWNAFKRITQGCSAAEKASLYCGTAARVYRLAV